MKYRRFGIIGAVFLLKLLKGIESQENSPLFFGTYSENFVIRWGYQSIGDHCFDPRLEAFPTNSETIATLEPANVRAGDIIFVRHAKMFMETIHPYIQYPYILITAGDYKDAMVDSFIDFLDDPKIIAWYCVHPCTRSHPKFHPLPLGIFQSREFYEKRMKLSTMFSRWRHAPKEKLLCSNFGLRPKFKPARNDIYTIFENKDFCHKASPKPFLEYMREMAQYKFVLSPQGIAPDTYRTWEALLVGTIPIVQTSHLDSLYEDLPILIINDWLEVTPEFLNKKYLEFTTKKFNIEKLCTEYWWNQIKHTQKDFLRDYQKKSITNETPQQGILSSLRKFFQSFREP